MSEPKMEVAPPAGAVITVTVPSLILPRSGMAQVSSGSLPTAPIEAGCPPSGTDGLVCGTPCFVCAPAVPPITVNTAQATTRRVMDRIMYTHCMKTPKFHRLPLAGYRGGGQGAI